MQATKTAPFNPDQADEIAIWDMLVRRDTEAFVAQDWDAVADDFENDIFFAIDAAGKEDPSSWKMSYPSIDSYRNEWLTQGLETSKTVEPALALEAILNATNLDHIEISGNTAIAHKKFDGYLPNQNGPPARLLWQTIYILRRISEKWKIVSFIGFLPNDVQELTSFFVASEKQHKTAGPYSPAIGVRGGSDIIVLSGQAPLNENGDVVGNTIDEQTRLTLENCKSQLNAAGLTLNDVFKATVYMTDLGNWSAFNTTYREYFSEPFPARTAIETGLLPGMLVEIEMWAAKP